MQPEQLIPLIGFIIAMVGTPGPNNLMLMSSGANFGFRRSIPHILGITFGCQTLLLGVALGLGKLLSLYPQAVLALQIFASAFIIYLAVSLVRPQAAKLEKIEDARPLTFLQASLFQWINPKAWMMFVTAIATYTNAENFVLSVLVIAILFVVVGSPLIVSWNYGGASLKRWLQTGERLQRFNWFMAVLLVGSLYPILFG